MRIIFLGKPAQQVEHLFDGHEVLSTCERIDRTVAEGIEPDLILSYGYRHRVPDEVIALAPIALNVHISLLPWNGGADPNLWSWLTNTPKGVTVHWLASAIDRGDIAAQQAVELDVTQTLRQTYETLQRSASALLGNLWPDLLQGRVPRSPMAPGGSYHRVADKAPHLHVLTDGWETPCRAISDYGRVNGLWIESE